MIQLHTISLSYNHGRSDQIDALRGVSLTVHPGELVGIIGHNGSGKSTLARLLTVLLEPTGGTLEVDGFSAPQDMWEIRQRVGLVFQHPDDQLVATTVIDDVAFGPENLGLPRAEVERRTRAALVALDLAPLAEAQISELASGQKQRLAIAGVLAMQPAYLVLDEPTTMLTPRQAQQLLATARRLRDEHGMAVLHITHYMHEVADFDRLIVMHQGRVLLDGPPRELFVQADELRAVGLDVPLVTRLGQRLVHQGVSLPPVVLSAAELTGALSPQDMSAGLPAPPAPDDAPAAPATQPVLEARDLHFSYLAGTPLEQPALCGASCAIYPGEMVALLGGSQAGKSTLIEFFNGLRRTEHGQVLFDGQDIAAPGFALEELRAAVGIVFQQTDAQLFEDTVGRDVSFGPRTLGLSPAESRAQVAQSLTAVGLDYEQFRNRYIHALSGGQRRRVALAGVLAMQPRVLILDEPTAGLDPRGAASLVDLVLELRTQHAMTIVVVSSRIDALAQAADRLLVMHEGQIVLEGSPRTLVQQGERLRTLGLDLPEPTELALALRQVWPGLRRDIFTARELEAAVLEALPAA